MLFPTDEHSTRKIINSPIMRNMREVLLHIWPINLAEEKFTKKLENF